MVDRFIFTVSDRTGITAESLGVTLLCHFPNLEFKTVPLPFVDTPEKARDAARKINESSEKNGGPPLIFATLADDEIREIIAASNGVLFDLFDHFLAPLEKELGLESEHSVGSSHGVLNPNKYTARIAALNFTMRSDDGMNAVDYDHAELIIIGVSRTAKTPTSLYLALHYGVSAANFPLLEDDLERARLQDKIIRHRKKLFGLTIDPARLRKIRQARYDKGRYAQLRQCEYEVAQAEAMYRRERIPFVNTTAKSVEEIAATILHKINLNRDLM
ncbi:MAG: Phosphoenolpyruvate synthase regulatory protein [Gammaproteobacteria bacterium]|nr:Phosphoenolpyruvate synthase regulatory protein [Gammaproteobacteria bacterium]